jgi:UDP-N-acetylmuramoylalanine--D-glutamate ligase
MNIKTQKFLVLGVSKSGYSASKYLLSQGAIVYIYEELRIKGAIDAVNELVSLGATNLNKENVYSSLNEIDVLIVSPGVPINHEIAIKCKELNKRIISEFEFGFLCLNPVSVAITGTNGKTTTVSLLKSVLDGAKIKNQLLGNVGIPVSSKIDEIHKDTICVCEVSSFQLETTNAYCPHIACVLNLSPDHLERHYTLENYAFLKSKLVSMQKESEYAVLNYDDLIVREMGENAKSKVIYVSLKEKVNGAYLDGENLCFNEQIIMPIEELSIKGEHNVQNALFVVAVSKLLGISNENIKQGLKNFKGVPHRIELVKEENGVKYYNDSKSTNTNSTITAIKYMQSPTVLIIGGQDKGEDYTALFKEIKNSKVIHTVITGASRYKMLKCAEELGIIDFSLVPNFILAINLAKNIVKAGENLLFSPACSSYDEFKNFEERGNAFSICVGARN